MYALSPLDCWLKKINEPCHVKASLDQSEIMKRWMHFRMKAWLSNRSGTQTAQSHVWLLTTVPGSKVCVGYHLCISIRLLKSVFELHQLSEKHALLVSYFIEKSDI